MLHNVAFIPSGARSRPRKTFGVADLYSLVFFTNKARNLKTKISPDSLFKYNARSLKIGVVYICYRKEWMVFEDKGFKILKHFGG